MSPYGGTRTQWGNAFIPGTMDIAPNTARTIGCKTWKSPVEYHNKKSKHGIQESEGNIFNPIFKGKIQGWKHPGRCAFAEPELLSQKSKDVVQKNNNGHKNPNNSHNYRDEIKLNPVSWLYVRRPTGAVGSSETALDLRCYITTWSQDSLLLPTLCEMQPGIV